MLGSGGSQAVRLFFLFSYCLENQFIAFLKTECAHYKTSKNLTMFKEQNKYKLLTYHP